MSQVPGAATSTTALTPRAARSLVTTDGRRWLQLALAATWVFDGILQYQTYMFSNDFSASFLAGMAQSNPDWIASSILWAAHIVGGNPVLINAGFADPSAGDRSGDRVPAHSAGGAGRLDRVVAGGLVVR